MNPSLAELRLGRSSTSILLRNLISSAFQSETSPQFALRDTNFTLHSVHLLKGFILTNNNRVRNNRKLASHLSPFSITQSSKSGPEHHPTLHQIIHHQTPLLHHNHWALSFPTRETSTCDREP